MTATIKSCLHDVSTGVSTQGHFMKTLVFIHSESCIFHRITTQGWGEDPWISFQGSPQTVTPWHQFRNCSPQHNFATQKMMDVYLHLSFSITLRAGSWQEIQSNCAELSLFPRQLLSLQTWPYSECLIFHYNL